MIEGEGGLELRVEVGIAVGWAVEREFEEVVLRDGDGVRGGCGDEGGSRGGEKGGGGELEDFAAIHGESLAAEEIEEAAVMGCLFYL